MEYVLKKISGHKQWLTIKTENSWGPSLERKERFSLIYLKKIKHIEAKSTLEKLFCI